MPHTTPHKRLDHIPQSQSLQQPLPQSSLAAGSTDAHTGLQLDKCSTELDTPVAYTHFLWVDVCQQRGPQPGHWLRQMYQSLQQHTTWQPSTARSPPCSASQQAANVLTKRMCLICKHDIRTCLDLAYGHRDPGSDMGLAAP